MTALEPLVPVEGIRPFDPDGAGDAGHRAMIAAGPLVAVTGPQGETVYVVTDPALVREMLADPRFVKNPRFAPASWVGREITLEPAYEEQRSITTADGEEHTLLRRMQVRLFSPAVLEEQRPRIRALATTQLGELAERDGGGPTDLMGEFCYQLPLSVIGGILGVGERELAELVATSRQSAHASSEDRVAELTAISAIIELALATGSSGAVAAALRGSAEFAQLGLSETELSYVVTGLVFAGQETTGAFLGAVVHAYLARPDRAELDEAGRAALVGEVLRRYPSSTYTLWRFAAVDADLGGHPVPAGSPIVADLEAANLHPDVAGPHGEVFDPGRARNRHLAFGHGPHTCLGARLAVLEAGEVLAVLRERFPRARLAGPAQPSWVADANVRRLGALAVVLS